MQRAPSLSQAYGLRACLARWFPGFTWAVAAKVALVNLLLAAILVHFFDNPFFDLLISVEILGFSVMLAIYAAAHRRIGRLPRPAILGLAVVLASVTGTLLLVVVKGHDVKQLFAAGEPLWAFLLTTSIGVGMGAIGAVIFSAQARQAEFDSQLHRAEAERQRLARQMAEAELKLMQAQVEPHFLYNTLANVQSLIETDPAEASRMLDHLIRYLRAALPRMREPLSTLGREADLAASYLAIVQMRMGKRLAFQIAVPESLRAAPFPPMMLMTLAENAVRHGIEPRREGGSIRVSAEVSAGRVRLTVADTGCGFAPREAGRQGVGLANIRERLKTLYGEAAQLSLEANHPHGVVARIEIPAEAPDRHPR